MDAKTLPLDDFSFGATIVLSQRREVLHEGAKIEVGERAFDLLLLLAASRGIVLSKDQIIARVWQNRVVEDNTVEGQISALRRALGNDRAAIRTVTGKGYQFTADLVAQRPMSTDANAHLRAPSVKGITLPAAISPLIGRENALSDVADVVRARRLITLVGAGGIGKTRLALEVARELSPHFADGVFMADLALTTSADYLPTTLAVALGFPAGDGTPSLDRLAAALATRHLLLVLDNCEHLIESAAQVAERLLRIAPFATVLATSREPLRITGEFIYRVPSLDVPLDDGHENARSFGAIQLFEERAGTDFHLRSDHPSTLPLVTRICRRLDGIPLAIELAAACVPILGLQGIDERLGDRFQLLTRGARTALPRQQTLRATLDWSYELLTETQRCVLNRVSVFAGPFTMESAQALASNETLSQDAVMAAIIDLVDKSLISVSSEGARYRLLETTRAYAQEKLRDNGALRDASSRHARLMLSIFSQAEAQATARVDVDWHACYAVHLPDLRAAVEWGFSADGDPLMAVELTIASIPVALQLALLEECLARVDRSIAWLDASGEPTDERLLKLYAARGMCLLCHTVDAPTSAAFAKTEEIAASTENSAYQLLGMWGSWMCHYLNGRYGEALPLSQRFDAVAKDTGWMCDRLASYRLTGMSYLFRGDLEQAADNLALAASSRVVLPKAQRTRFLYDERMLSHASLALTLWFMGRVEEAKAAARQSLDDARELDHPVSLCYALSESVATLALMNGDEALLRDSVAAMRKETHRHSISTWRARSRMWDGFIELFDGSGAAFGQIIHPAMIAIGSKRNYLSLTPFLTATAELLLEQGRVNEAADLIDPAVERARETGDVCSLPELLRTKAEILLADNKPGDRVKAESLLADALACARQHKLRSWELRCAASLAGLKATTMQ